MTSQQNKWNGSHNTLFLLLALMQMQTRCSAYEEAPGVYSREERPVELPPIPWDLRAQKCSCQAKPFAFLQQTRVESDMPASPLCKLHVCVSPLVKIFTITDERYSDFMHEVSWLLLSGLRRLWPQGWGPSSDLVRKGVSWERVEFRVRCRTREGPAHRFVLNGISQRAGSPRRRLTEKLCSRCPALWQGLWGGVGMAPWLPPHRQAAAGSQTDRSPRQELGCGCDPEPFTGSAQITSGSKAPSWGKSTAWFSPRKNQSCEFSKRVYWAPIPHSPETTGVPRQCRPGSAGSEIASAESVRWGL